MEDDLLLAIRLQEQFDREDRGPDRLQEAGKRRRLEAERPLSIVDQSWEVLDPNPDVRALFLDFNQRFFWGKLSGVEVKWSPRMTLCAGVCSYEGRGGLCSIRLSEPLLKLRPRKDLVETLLHEMIHALLFVTQNNRDRDGHGPEFCKHMNRINQASGTRITVYHSFHDEVDVYRQHWWRCDGPCRTRRPYLGWVKRAMNRAPSPLDPWWDDHRRTCGGTYTKVKEPEGYGQKGNKRGNKQKEGGNKQKEGGNKQKEGGNKQKEGGNKQKEGGNKQKEGGTKGQKSSTTGSGSQDVRSVVPFSGRGFLLGGSSSPFRTPTSVPDSAPRTAAAAGGRPPGRTSVANTRAFVNVNGSPVKIPKPQRSSAPAAGGGQKSLPELFRRPPSASGSPRVPPRFSPDRVPGGSQAAARHKQTSIQDLFSRSSSKTPTRDSSPLTQPPVPFSTQEPPGSSAGPSLSRFFGDSPGRAGGGATAAGGGAAVAAPSRKRPRDEANASSFSNPGSSTPGSSSSSLTVRCPVCQVQVQEAKINQHLDSCLT